MSKVRNRAANSRGSRRARVLRTLEVLESRCVLNAGPPTMLFGGLPQSGGSSLHSDYGEYVAGPRGASDSHISLMGDAAMARPASGPMGFAVPPSPDPVPGFPPYDVAGGGLHGPDPLSVARADSVMMAPIGVVDVFESRPGYDVVIEHTVYWGAIGAYDGGPPMGSFVAVSRGVEYDAYGASKTFAIPLPEAPLPMARQYGLSLAIDVLPAIAALPQSAPSSQTNATIPQSQAGNAAAESALAARGAIFELPAAAAQVHQAIVTDANGATGSLAASDSTIQGGWLISRNAPPAENRPVAIPNLATVADQHRSTPALALAGRSRTGGAATEVPPESASLAGMTLDVHGVERALETVMSEIELLGAGLTHWLDDVHFTRLAVATTAAALGLGSAYYRRRGVRETVRGDDEESLSWLFARMQPIPGE
jgi:hypothetical protein